MKIVKKIEKKLELRNKHAQLKTDGPQTVIKIIIKNIQLFVNVFLIFQGYIVPKGTTAMIVADMVQMDPKYFPNPTQYDPDRFKDAADIHPYSFMAFSAGIRNCIGLRLAVC